MRLSILGRVVERGRELSILKRVIKRGGPGSGHFGHAGRDAADEVGGSLPAGKGGGKGKGEKHVGLTSARPGREEEETVLEDMLEFEALLKEIAGVSQVSVELGEGGWEGGSEPTWVISFDGDGDALSLIAKTAKKFNQDGVLIYEACKGAGCSPVVTWTFGGSISDKERDIVQNLMVARGIGGWTWYNDGNQKALRAVSVPQWGGDAKKHLSAADLITESFNTAGVSNSRKDFDATVTIMEKEGENSYDSYIEESGEEDE
ncbi:hypothetical protein LCGC14_0665610 [marine sediment metagenome]|uniref:Uncharacterized protein n=1 Tax=marine sediment metagenome TaxID=412755 RepID=A0A0F9QSA4_9ZZZZ